MKSRGHLRALWLLLAVLTVDGSALSADPTPTFLALARRAIGGADALARVHSLHIATIDDIAPDTGRPGFTGDWLGAGQGDRPRVLTHVWLALPSRFLQVTAGRRSGFDDDRPIGLSPFVFKSPLWRWALPLLLPDPGALGLTLAGESNDTLGKNAVHVVDVSGPDGFDARLYFDAQSLRLVMTRFTIPAVAISGQTGTPGGTHLISEEDTYSDYKRVRSADVSIELPFLIRRQVQLPASTVTTELAVVAYTLNPKDLDEQFK